MISKSANNLFEGYKCIGLVSSSVPHLIRYIEKLNKIQVITAVGRSFLLYNEKLQLIETCVAHQNEIDLLASNSKFLFTASSNEIFAWKFGHRWKSKSYRGCQSRVVFLMVFGPQLLAIDNENVLYIWDIGSQDLILSIPFQSFLISSILHPSTYINKILLGSYQGTLQLWNIAHQKLIYQFNGWNSKVTVLVQAPALHVIAIGHENGLIVLHHLQQDETLMKFRQEWGPVTSMTFRTDDVTSISMLVTASNQTSHLAIWNLEEIRLEQVMRDVHHGSVAGASFIDKQALLVTNSDDNCLKIWAFDDLQVNGRVLYSRGGHRSPPTRIRFYGESNVHHILSAGSDSTLKAFSIYSERLNRDLGTALINKNFSKKNSIQANNVLAPFTEIAFETVREKDWDNIACCHRRTRFVSTWSWHKTTAGRFKLLHERFRNHDNVYAESVFVSSCGNFVLIGYNTGHLDRFNLQSGIHRCHYGEPKAHDGQVRTVVSDSLSQLVISGGSDQLLKIWRFAQNQLLGSLSLSNSINRLIINKLNDLVAVALDNFDVLVLDVESKKIVRRFANVHQNQVTDMVFDHVGEKLFVSCMDSLIYIWDMLSSNLVDVLRTQTPCVSLTLSPSGEFLATAHVDDLAIYLWSNVSVYSHVTLKKIETENLNRVLVTRLPQIQSDEIDIEQKVEIVANHGDHSLNVEKCQEKFSDQISKNLITLSNLSHSRWKNLLCLDQIKKRNKPQEPIEKPQKAPFFLPTLVDLNLVRFGSLKPSSSSAVKSQSTLFDQTFKKAVSFDLLPPFVRMLNDCFQQRELAKFFQHIKQLGSSRIDLEFRSLSAETTGTNQFMLQFMHLMQAMLMRNRDFELVNAYLALFLKIHIDFISKDLHLANQSQQLLEMVEERCLLLESYFDRSLCMISYLRNALL